MVRWSRVRNQAGRGGGALIEVVEEEGEEGEKWETTGWRSRMRSSRSGERERGRQAGSGRKVKRRDGRVLVTLMLNASGITGTGRHS